MTNGYRPSMLCIEDPLLPGKTVHFLQYSRALSQLVLSACFSLSDEFRSCTGKRLLLAQRYSQVGGLRDVNLRSPKIFSLSKLDYMQTVQLQNALEMQSCVEYIIRFSDQPWEVVKERIPGNPGRGVVSRTVLHCFLWEWIGRCSFSCHSLWCHMSDKSQHMGKMQNPSCRAVLQRLHRNRGWVSAKTSCIVVVCRELCITGFFLPLKGPLGNAS